MRVLRSREPGQADEVVLCTIRASPNGVICIQPDFNKSRKPYKIESPGSCRGLYSHSLTSSLDLNNKNFDVVLYSTYI